MVPGDERILTHLRRGAVEYCVLALVAESPAYGLDIARRLTCDGILMSGEGTLYPLLSRLRTAGHVETTWQESTEGPPRRYYSITTSGARSLEAFRATWIPFRQAVDSAIVAAGVTDAADPPTTQTPRGVNREADPPPGRRVPRPPRTAPRRRIARDPS